MNRSTIALVAVAAGCCGSAASALTTVYVSREMFDGLSCCAGGSQLGNVRQFDIAGQRLDSVSISVLFGFNADFTVNNRTGATATVAVR